MSTNTKKNLAALVVIMIGLLSLLILVLWFSPEDGLSQTPAEQKGKENKTILLFLLERKQEKKEEVGELRLEEKSLEKRLLDLQTTLVVRSLSDEEAEEHKAILLRKRDVVASMEECEIIISYLRARVIVSTGGPREEEEEQVSPVQKGESGGQVNPIQQQASPIQVQQSAQE